MQTVRKTCLGIGSFKTHIQSRLKDKANNISGIYGYSIHKTTSNSISSLDKFKPLVYSLVASNLTAGFCRFVVFLNTILVLTKWQNLPHNKYTANRIKNINMIYTQNIASI